MGYGGRQAIRSGDIRRFNFTGNGSNTIFDLGFTPATQNQLIVTVNGLVQHYDAFSISGSTLTFTGTPGSGDAIQVTAVVDAVGVAAIPDGAIANVSTLAVSGAATFANSVAITGNTTFSNTTAHTGAATFSSTVAVAGNLSTTSQLLANGDIKNITATNPTIWSANSAALTDGSMYMQFNTSSSEGRLGSYTNHPLVLLTNNTRQVIIDGSGRVTTPYQPSFRAYTSTSVSSGGGNYNVVFNQVIHNVGSHYNNSTGYFTAPVTGYYVIGYAMLCQNDMDIHIIKNGVSWQLLGRAKSATTLQGSVVTYLTANDYVNARITSASVSAYGDSDAWSQFFGYLLG